MQPNVQGFCKRPIKFIQNPTLIKGFKLLRPLWLSQQKVKFMENCVLLNVTVHKG